VAAGPALIAADYVIVPVAPGLFSMQGLENVGPRLAVWREQWDDRRSRAPSLHRQGEQLVRHDRPAPLRDGRGLDPALAGQLHQGHRLQDGVEVLAEERGVRRAHPDADLPGAGLGDLDVAGHDERGAEGFEKGGGQREATWAVEQSTAPEIAFDCWSWQPCLHGSDHAPDR